MKVYDLASAMSVQNISNIGLCKSAVSYSCIIMCKHILNVLNLILLGCIHGDT